MISKAELQHWHDVLLKLRGRLEVDSAQILGEATYSSESEGTGSLSNMPTYLGDTGSQEAAEAVTVGMAENEAALVREVEDALTRIRENRFGVCETCRKPIPKPRLTVLPYARCCVPCAKLPRDLQPK